MKAKDIMVHPPLVLKGSTSVATALKSLVCQDEDGAVVVDSNDNFTGMVSTKDLAGALANRESPHGSLEGYTKSDHSAVSPDIDIKELTGRGPWAVVYDRRVKGIITRNMLNERLLAKSIKKAEKLEAIINSSLFVLFLGLIILNSTFTEQKPPSG
ncbi:CBS domain-containing protein [Desulfoscipio sp. XC116]|uniref:CBS domain-containing protein n=1 Tax=Desulfoscipio sp. XC116 TaxID=3144975 RepID=UPI00325A6C75